MVAISLMIMFFDICPVFWLALKYKLGSNSFSLWQWMLYEGNGKDSTDEKPSGLYMDAD